MTNCMMGWSQRTLRELSGRPIALTRALVLTAKELILLGVVMGRCVEAEEEDLACR